MFLIALILVYVAEEAVTPGIHHSLLQGLICLAVGFVTPLFHQFGAHLTNRCAHWIAKYSYGIYLFHCIALWLACYQLMQWSIIVVMLVAMSLASFRLLEQPAVRLARNSPEVGSRRSRRRPDMRRSP